ncbi:MAG: T9SS type A sorting domain-containing protein [Bacteroidetes Order II. Incertae sedis bacterium]|nr:T9SS type A sorting domain-containing protein [Bacteroidetes Order II. bacterium]
MITSTHNLGSTEIRRSHDITTVTGSSIARKYFITPTNNSSLDAILRFYYFDAELNGNDEHLMVLWRSNDNGATWTPQSGNTQDITANWIQQTGIPTFSTWTAASATALPILLISATATIKTQTATLYWTTAQEINSDRFVIERQTTQDSKQVGEIKGQDNITEQHDYAFTIPNLAYGQHLFRIAQQNRNGLVSYTNPFSVFVELTDALALSEVYPNPFNPSTNFTLAVGQTQNVQIRVFDLLGRQVALLHQGRLDGQTTHTFSFHAEGLASGKYVARIQGEYFIAHKHLVLLK